MNWFWHALWICAVVIPITILWVACIFDLVFRRHDLAGWKRVIWLLVVIVLPVLGALIYAAAGGGAMLGSHRTTIDGQMDYRDLETMRASGALNQGEYERARDRLDVSSRGRPPQ